VVVPRVGFVGVGQMGRPMVDRLTAAGIPTEVFVRRDDLREELVGDGVAVADSVAELAGRSDLLILCLFDDDQVRRVMLESGVIATMRVGSVLASHVTGSPRVVVDLQAAAPAGVTVLDAPISGTSDHIRRGELTILVGGDLDAFERVRPAFEAYGRPILHVGGLGDALRAKLVNNLLFTVNLRVAVDAARLGRSLGIEPADLARIIGECSGASFALDLFRSRDPELAANGARHYLAKDVNAVRKVADDLGVDLGDLGQQANWVFGD
jgi:3-hydroxyisobutyrate dehydrogenase-like beta-hydroxyacid dehydrogenase